MASTPPPAPTPPAPQPSPGVRLPFPLQDGESPVLISRRHWLYLWPSIALRLLYALLPVGVIAFGLSAAGGFEGAGEKVFLVVTLVWLLYWAVRLFLMYYAYHNDLWVITNQRIVDCFRPNPFNMRLSTADLVNVQDMTVHRSGLLRTVFDFGDIVCQTAADNQDFRLVGIPRPREVQALVDRERDRERLRYT